MIYSISNQFRSTPLRPILDNPVEFAKVRIGGDVWIGAQVCILPGGSEFIETTGSGDLTTGSAVIRANGQIQASAIFSILDQSESLITETGVAAVDSKQEFVLPVDNSGDLRTGLAVFNPDETDVATLTLRRFDFSGQQVGGSQET